MSVPQGRTKTQPKKGKRWEEAFVPFPSALLSEARDGSWTATEFLVYLTIGDRVDRKTGVALLKFETLRRAVGCSRAQLYRARRALVERGVLYFGERHGEDGVRLADAYRLTRPGDEEDQAEANLTSETGGEEVSFTRPPSLTNETRSSHGGDSPIRKSPEEVFPEGPVGLSGGEPRAEASQPDPVEAETDGQSASPEAIQEPPVDHPHYDTLSVLWEIRGWVPDLEADTEQLQDLAGGVALGVHLPTMAERFRGEFLKRYPQCAKPAWIKAAWWRHVAECPEHRRPMEPLGIIGAPGPWDRERPDNDADWWAEDSGEVAG
jgi:Helix-turn-helix domain